MKARISPRNKLTKKEQDMMIELAEEALSKKQYSFMRRIFKAFCYVMNRTYGFGKQRLNIAISEIEKTMNECITNEMFWEQLDRVVIDEIGLDFVRETTDKDGKAVFTDGDTEIFTGKKKA
ncbi:MAG: hypothetical protein VZR27_10245 [Acutalibacteraceae bacterium]|nr:hypothetical protein [Acutalibacteraceae bacterium]